MATGDRFEIALKSKVKTAILLSNNWVGTKQNLTFDGVTESTKGVIGLSDGYDYEQAISAKLSYAIISDNIVEVTANGDVPTVNFGIKILIVD